MLPPNPTQPHPPQRPHLRPHLPARTPPRTPPLTPTLTPTSHFPAHAHFLPPRPPRQLLLSNDCFDFLSAEEHPFPLLLLATVAAEMKACRDVTKICLGARYDEPGLRVCRRTWRRRGRKVYLSHAWP